MINPEMQPQASEHPAKPKSETPLTEGLPGPRQKELVTLPDGQVITVIGQESIRTLQLLIVRFNQDQPNVLSEELLGFDTAQGILPSEKQRKKLSETLSGLKNRKLTGTGWHIQSITVNGKGKEKLKGYTLRKDQAPKADSPTVFLQSVLDKPIVLKRLVTNGQEKASILEQAKQQINNFDEEEKVIFLQKTFAILSDPDTDIQDRRDAALELLRVTDLASINQLELRTTYVKAISNLRNGLNQNSDPNGEIYMLLEAGKTIAPFIGNGHGIIQSWNLVANFFKGDNDRQGIVDAIKQIREISRLTPARISEFDTSVLELIQEGLLNQEIAKQLKVRTKNDQTSSR